MICGNSISNKSDQAVDEKNRPKIKLVIDRVAKVMKPGPMSSLEFVIRALLYMIQCRNSLTDILLQKTQKINSSKG